jgi:hypothetical protein
MWTTRIWKTTLLCGWLTATLAAAQPETLDAAPEALDAVPGAARAVLAGEAPDMKAPHVETLGVVDESQFFMEDPESMDAPVLRYAEPLSCPAAPEGRVWVADTEECGEAECIHKTTVWIGSWTIEDAEMEVRCETDRIVLGTHDWQLVLAPDALGRLDVAEATPAEPEQAPAELAGESSRPQATET